MKLSVVIPVYNSRYTIGRLVDQLIGEWGGRCNLEVLLINDASNDDSAMVCRALHEKHAGAVRYFEFTRNKGEQAAVLKGLTEATGDFALIMDDDQQNPVSEVKILVDFIQAGRYEVVYSKYEIKHHARVRNWGSWVNNWVAKIIYRKPRGLYLSSFKILSRSLIDRIIKNAFPFLYIDGLILRLTDNIGQIIVEHAPRQWGDSGYTSWKLLVLQMSVVWTGLRRINHL